MVVNNPYYEVETLIQKDVFYYSFPWPIENDTDVVVYYGYEGQERTLLSPTYYEIQNHNTIYINQTFLNEELVGQTLYIERHTPRTQDLTLQPKAAINPTTLEKALDHLEYQIQELDSNEVTEDVLISFNTQLYLIQQEVLALQQSLNTESATRASQVNDINSQIRALTVRIDSFDNLGHYLGTYDTYAQVPKTTTVWGSSAGINDFVNVRQDENHSNSTTRYIISAINGTAITWSFDIELESDVSGKADKVVNATAGHVASLDASGNLVDSGIVAESMVSDDTKLPLTGGTMLGPINMNGSGIYGVPDPTTDDGVVNRRFMVQYHGSTGGGGGEGTLDHNLLTADSRNSPNQHTQEAIVNLVPDLAAKAPTNSPTFTGTPTAPTLSYLDSSTKLATTMFVKSQGYAITNSPIFTGTPTAPTPTASDNTTKLATTAFVKAQGYAPLASPAFAGVPTAPTPLSTDNSTQLATTAFVKAQAYASPLNYSESEQDTGTKWLDGKKIYRKTVNVGALPNNAVKEVAHGVANIERIVMFDGVAADGIGYRTMNFPGATVTIGTQITTSAIRITTVTDQSSYSGYVTMYYTCTNR